MPETSQHSLSLRETCAHLKEDKRRVALLCARKFGYTPWMIWLDPSMLCVALYRIAHYSMRRGFGKMGHLLTQLNTILQCIDIHPASDIGAGLLIPHPHGVQFSANAGRNLTILPLAGVGSTFSAKDVGAGPGLSCWATTSACYRSAGSSDR